MRILALTILVAICLAASPVPSVAQGIEQLLLERIPVPTPRSAQIQSAGRIANSANEGLLTSNAKSKIVPARGSLSDGLKSLKKDNTSRALAIRAGMQPGSLDQKILAWAMSIIWEME